MTIDTSNPNKLRWCDLPRDVKAEMLLQWQEGECVQWLHGGTWFPTDMPFIEGDQDIYRIRPAEKRETVTRCLAGYPGVVAFEFETVNGVPDKSVQPRWVE